MNILDKIKMLRNIASTYENWAQIILGRYGLLGKGFIVCNLKNGLKIKMRKKSMDYAAMSEVFLRRDYDKFFEVKKDDIVIDVGAQIGAFSVLAGNKDAKVYSFEPEKNNFELLNENVKANLFTKKIKCFNFAIDAKKGTGYLNISKNLGGHSFFNEVATIGSNQKIDLEKQKIEKITLKDIFDINKLNRCDFLKMDCEGAEYDVIFNTSKKILEKIEKISMEYHVLDENNEIKMKEFLEKNGFKVTMTKQSDIGTGMIYAVR